MASREKIEAVLDAARDRHAARAERMIEARVKADLATWHRRFPKRRLRFIDAMGSVCVWIDDRQEVEITCRDKRLAALTAPLRSLVDWYCAISDDNHCCIADVIIEPSR